MNPECDRYRKKEQPMSPEQEAIDAWFASEEGKRCCGPGAEGEFLRNRLWKAFIAGVSAGRKIREKELMQQILETFLGRKS